MSLNVMVENERARSLYERLEFEEEYDPGIETASLTQHCYRRWP